MMMRLIDIYLSHISSYTRPLHFHVHILICSFTSSSFHQVHIWFERKIQRYVTSLTHDTDIIYKPYYIYSKVSKPQKYLFHIFIFIWSDLIFNTIHATRYLPCVQIVFLKYMTSATFLFRRLYIYIFMLHKIKSFLRLFCSIRKNLTFLCFIH